VSLAQHQLCAWRAGRVDDTGPRSHGGEGEAEERGERGSGRERGRGGSTHRSPICLEMPRRSLPWPSRYEACVSDTIGLAPCRAPVVVDEYVTGAPFGPLEQVHDVHEKQHDEPPPPPPAPGFVIICCIRLCPKPPNGSVVIG